MNLEDQLADDVKIDCDTWMQTRWKRRGFFYADDSGAIGVIQKKGINHQICGYSKNDSVIDFDVTDDEKLLFVLRVCEVRVCSIDSHTVLYKLPAVRSAVSLHIFGKRDFLVHSAKRLFTYGPCSSEIGKKKRKTKDVL